MWKNKKAVSPLIAAVLLIVVVVGVGAVVTGIVRNYVTAGKQTIDSKSGDIKCGSEVGISVPTVANEIRICKDSTNGLLNFTLDNTGSTTIDELQVKFFSSSAVEANDSIKTTNDETSVASGATESFSVPIPTAIGATNIVEVHIVPRVQVVGRAENAYCVDSALKYNPQEC